MRHSDPQDEESQTRRAIMESLRQQCDFCAMSFRNIEELQDHVAFVCQKIDTNRVDLPVGSSDNNPNPSSTTTPKSLIILDTKDKVEPNNLIIPTKDGEASEIGSPMTTNYRLNEVKALHKKNNACSRDPYYIQEHTNNAVITLNTGTFEFFSNLLKQYLKSCSQYILKDSPMYDTGRRVVQDILKVYHHDNTTHLYTINLYRTKCRALINGPYYEKFLSDDLIVIEKQITSASETIEEANNCMQKAIAECIITRGQVSHPRNPANPKKRNSTASSANVCERKLYGTRSRSKQSLDVYVPPEPESDCQRETSQHIPTEMPPIPYTQHPNTSPVEESSPLPNEIPPSTIEEEILNKQAEALVSEVLDRCARAFQKKTTAQSEPEHTSPTTTEDVMPDVKEICLGSSNPQGGNNDNIDQHPQTPEPISNANSSRPKRTTVIPSKYRDSDPTPIAKSQPPKPQHAAIPHNETGKNLTQEVLYCKCKQPWSELEGDTMTFCESCKEWLHYQCAGVDKEKVDEVDKFVCMQCAMKLFIQHKLSETEEDQKEQASSERTKKSDSPSDTQLKTKECENLVRAMAEMKEKHYHDLDLKQQSLESLSSQNKKVQKENAKHLQKIDTLEKMITQLELEKKKLGDQNAAHLEFVRSSLQNNGDNTIDQIQKLRENDEHLKTILADKEQEILNLQSQISPDNLKQKNSSMKKEIENLTSRIRYFEESMNTSQETNLKTLNELQVATANYKRERELNDILMKRVQLVDTLPGVANISPPAIPTTENHEEPTTEQNIHQADNRGNPETTDDTHQREGTPPVADNNEVKDPCCYEYHTVGSCPFRDKCKFNHNISETSRTNPSTQEKMKEILESSNKPNSGYTRICVHEFFSQGSCPFHQRRSGCKFSHEISQEMRDNPNISEALQKINQEMTRRDKQSKSKETSQPDICFTTFRDGPNSCRGPCQLKHDLDFKRIKRGICYYKVLGDCKWNDKCKFTHEIPSIKKKNAVVIEAAKRFTKGQTRPAYASGQNLMSSTNSNLGVIGQGNQTMAKAPSPSMNSDPFLWDSRRTLQSQPPTTMNYGQGNPQPLMSKQICRPTMSQPIANAPRYNPATPQQSHTMQQFITPATHNQCPITNYHQNFPPMQFTRYAQPAY